MADSLTDATKWQLAYIQSFNAVNIGAVFLPIPDFESGILTNPAFRVLAANSEAYRNWEYAATVSIMVDIGGSKVSVLRQSLKLNRQQLIIVPSEYISYTLLFDVAKWHKQFTVSVSGFTGVLTQFGGDIGETLQNVIEQDCANGGVIFEAIKRNTDPLSAKLDNLQTKVNEIDQNTNTIIGVS